MIGAHAVLVADGAAMGDDRFADRLLERAPATGISGVIGAAAPDHGHVDAAAGIVDMRQMGERQSALVKGLEREMRGLLHGGHGGGRPRPGHGGFHGVDREASIPQAVAQIGAGKAVLRPDAAHRGAHVHTTGTARDRERIRLDTLGLFPAAGRAEHHHRRPIAQPPHAEIAAQPGNRGFVTGDAQLGIRLDLVGHPQHRHRHFSVGDRARRFEGRVPVREEHGVEGFARSHGRDVNRCFGDDAQTSLAAEHELAQIRPGRGGHAPADLEFAARTGQPRAVETVLDAAVAARLLAGGAGHDPAAERGVVERLRVVAEHESLGAQLGFHHRPGRPCAQTRDAVMAVEFEQPRIAARVDADHRSAIVDNLEMADHAGAAAVGDHHRARGTGRIDRGLCFVVGRRRGDRVRKRADMPMAQCGPVGEALAVGVAQAGFGRGIEAVGQVESGFRHLGTGTVEARVGADLAAPETRFQKRARAIR